MNPINAACIYVNTKMNGSGIEPFKGYKKTIRHERVETFDRSDVDAMREQGIDGHAYIHMYDEVKYKKNATSILH